MRKFKKVIYILIILIIPMIIIMLSINFYSQKFSKISADIKSIIEVSNEVGVDFSCTKNNAQNIKIIAKDYNLDYYEGDIVKEEISKNFSDPRIPKGYRFSKDDLQESYALAKKDMPIIVYLSFEDKNKFDKINEFLTYGEFFVGYSKRVDSKNNEIFLGNKSENLTVFTNQFLIQRCY